MSIKTIGITVACVIVGLLAYELLVKKVFKLNSYEEYESFDAIQ